MLECLAVIAQIATSLREREPGMREKERRGVSTSAAQGLIDVIVVGGGRPAGMSAALLLGRCCRRVLLVDAGHPRNWASSALWGYLSRDGIAPAEFRARSREQLARYENVEFREDCVTDVRCRVDGTFDVYLESDPTPRRTRALLLATGLVDRLPKVSGLAPLFGTSVFECPYCDGWQFRGKRLGAYGNGSSAMGLARALKAWSEHVHWFTDGPTTVSARDRLTCERNGIAVVNACVARLAAEGLELRAVELDDGRKIPLDALFVDTVVEFQSALTQRLGCERTEEGGIAVDRYQATTIPGVFVAGNIVRDLQLAIVAAAEGAKAAIGVNHYLNDRDLDVA